MKTTTQIIILIVGCLFIGAVIGWSLRSGGAEERASAHAHETGTEFTCSMHPQIRQPGPGSCPLCGMALIPVENQTGQESLSPHVLEMTPEAVAMSNISTSHVTSGRPDSEIALNGKIQIDERRVLNIAADYAGRVEQLMVAFTGQEVKKGEKLATVYSPDLISAQKELIEAKKLIEENPALYQAARNKLKQWKLSESQIDLLAEAEEAQRSFDIVADVNGVVSQKNIAVGDYVNRGTVLFEVIDLDRVWVLLDAYESDLSAFGTGDLIRFKVNAYPNQTFEGRVNFIDPMLDAQSRTLKIRAEAANPQRLLKPEMFVTAIVEPGAGDREEAMLIPTSSVLWTGKKSLVYVQIGDREQPAFELREVELGSSTAGQTVVLSGLEIGEEVVSQGAFAVDAAAQLLGNYSMMNRPQARELEVPLSFYNELGHLLDHYFKIKDYLVDSNGEKAAVSASALQEAHRKVDTQSLGSEAQHLWATISAPLLKSAAVIADSHNLEEQRKGFQTLSGQLIALLDHTGAGKLVIYQQHCPMADQDQGASWLSLEKEIRNPYYGEAMLRCGELKETYHKSSG